VDIRAPAPSSLTGLPPLIATERFEAISNSTTFGFSAQISSTGTHYSPSLPAAVCRSARMYLRTMALDRCPVWRMIESSEAPLPYASVANPALSEWAP
jgi:hypothetical protein